jgi:hypothetical protein
MLPYRSDDLPVLANESNDIGRTGGRMAAVNAAEG